MQDNQPPQIDPDASPEERKRQLKEAAKEHKQEIEQEQQSILEDIQSEHGGDLIETEVDITPDYTATVETKLDGQLLQRMERIEKDIEQFESGSGRVRHIGDAMEQASKLLADIIVEEEYDERLFMGVYEAEGPDVLGDIIENVFDGLQAERERRAEAVSGFRSKPS